MLGAPSYILVSLAQRGEVKLFHGCKTKDLGQMTLDQVPGLYTGSLMNLDLVKLLNSQTPS